ncbi:tryptophan-rich sensory protein [Candidatus Micrarchaeota archaeon]|nr:tryptophan-rich sensory protein [Candidatus Micrarchaeota archaeon]
MKNKAVALIATILICEIAGVIGSLFTYQSIPDWYNTSKLNKPSFTPPSWLFAPVWVTLYFLMGVSAYLIWEKGAKKKEVRNALSIFGVQLFLNVLWSILFFGLRCPLCGFVEIILLWLAIAATIIKFNKLSRAAAFLLIPYILWVTFAALLNFYVWMLNP